MLYMNKAMEEIVSTQIIESYNNEINSILDKIVQKTRRIQDSVIFDEDEIDESTIDFERIFKFVDDWTGYEISCNEIRIEKSILSSNQYVTFANMLHEMLKNKYIDKKFVVYICLNDNYIEVRFHTYRENEGFWLNENLNIYRNPILYVC
ncbi:hypothetical protein [Thomasclavelia cocleata]|uniref:hypothetical protein n=1 Tax=Thomasclavelia cocleata TaxID=69824 RepID=UPI00248BEC78|nr:hypothetical protein [Thomasclavelia cocleata]